MHPILFTIPGIDFPVRSFGLMVAAGFLLGTWILGKLVQRGSQRLTVGCNSTASSLHLRSRPSK